MTYKAGIVSRFNVASQQIPKYRMVLTFWQNSTPTITRVTLKVERPRFLISRTSRMMLWTG